MRVLPDWDAGTLELNAFFPSGKSTKPAARALVEYLAEELRSIANTDR